MLAMYVKFTNITSINMEHPQTANNMFHILSVWISYIHNLGHNPTEKCQYSIVTALVDSISKYILEYISFVQYIYHKQG